MAQLKKRTVRLICVEVLNNAFFVSTTIRPSMNESTDLPELSFFLLRTNKFSRTTNKLIQKINILLINIKVTLKKPLQNSVEIKQQPVFKREDRFDHKTTT